MARPAMRLASRRPNLLAASHTGTRFAPENAAEASLDDHRDIHVQRVRSGWTLCIESAHSVMAISQARSRKPLIFLGARRHAFWKAAKFASQRIAGM